ncbi:VOC family protein [Actinomadura roseirufa]|uniref:VOC family protein n=1 Tax=Actinomadura roseirufa TaxID=2094049 RepID=UPI001041B064|nr:VOC family protein [Actinomadura roseirufa]
MRIVKFMHAKLDVKDLPASEEFYRDRLGLREIARYPLQRGAIVQYAPEGSTAGVELWFESGRRLAPPTELHFAFQVDDVDAWVDALRAQGVAIDREPFEEPGERIAFVRDPDGYLIELNQPLVPSPLVPSTARDARGR